MLIFSNCLPRTAPYRHWFVVVVVFTTDIVVVNITAVVVVAIIAVVALSIGLSVLSATCSLLAFTFSFSFPFSFHICRALWHSVQINCQRQSGNMTKKAKLSNGTRRIRNKNWSDTNARQKIHESFAFTFTFNVQRSTYRCCVVTSFRSNGTRRPSLCCWRCSHRTITEHSRNTWNTSKRPTRQRAQEPKSQKSRGQNAAASFSVGKRRRLVANRREQASPKCWEGKWARERRRATAAAGRAAERKREERTARQSSYEWVNANWKVGGEWQRESERESAQSGVRGRESQRESDDTSCAECKNIANVLCSMCDVAVQWEEW